MDAPVTLVKSALASVVHVQTAVPHDHPSAGLLGEERMGSGCVVDRDGLILTVNYVVMGGSEILVSLQDDREVPAKLVAQDFETGLALLQVRGVRLPPLPVGTFANLTRGQPVFVLAASGAEERRVSGGCITYLGEFDAYWEYWLETGIMASAFNLGFGGGALLDLQGQLLGVVSLSLNELCHHSFTIPVDYYTRHRKELIRYGRVTSRPRRGWIGFFPHPGEDGIVVAGVIPGGPGERAGLREGDLILAVNQREVLSRKELYHALWEHKPGERVQFELVRGDEAKCVEVVCGDRSEFYAQRKRDRPESRGGEREPGTNE
jgi:S1-C subfamily serine protease